MSDAGDTWRIATRRSALAQTQAKTVADALIAATGRPAELVPLATTGDDHPDRAIEAFDSKGLFVDQTRQAVLAGQCHMVVHSYKDLPTEPAENLTIGAVPARVDPRDVLVSRQGWSLDDIPTDRPIVVGTSSPRRGAQLTYHRSNVTVTPIRGNIQTRMGKVTAGELDAVVLAMAGLVRLQPDIGVLRAVPFTHEQMLHAPAQGALAVECRADDEATLTALAAIDDEMTRVEVDAERAMLARLEGGCTAPIGAHAGGAGNGTVRLTGVLADPNGAQLHRISDDAPPAEAAGLGNRVAEALLEVGAAILGR